jgi:hypothetical protein
MRYVAEINLVTEKYVDNNPSQGVDPDSWTEQGTIETLSAPSLKELIIKLDKKYNLTAFEDFEGRLEGASQTVDCGDHVLENWSIYFSRVETENININIETALNVLKGA